MKYAKTNIATSFPEFEGLGLTRGEEPRAPLLVFTSIVEGLLPTAWVARDQVSGSRLGSLSSPPGPRGLYTGIGGIIENCVWTSYRGGSTAVVAAEHIVPLRAAAGGRPLTRDDGVALTGSIAAMGMSITAPDPPLQAQAGGHGSVLRSVQGQALWERWERCSLMGCSGDDIPTLPLSWTGAQIISYIFHNIYKKARVCSCYEPCNMYETIDSGT